MKKQLLILSLAGLFSLTACGKSRELTPVDDVTGLERAEAILAKENEFYEKVISGGNIKDIFTYLPTKMSYRSLTTLNGKIRTIIPGSPLPVSEQTFNNYVEDEFKFEFNFETLQLHRYSYSDDTEVNTFYDETKGEYYHLVKIVVSGYELKTKQITKAANLEEAKECFFNELNNYSGDFQRLVPSEYLAEITKKENDKYTLLDAYDAMQEEYFDRFGDSNEYFKHQFGSDDANSFSLKNNLKIKVDKLMSGSIPIISKGYSEGTNAAQQNPYLSSILGDYLFMNYGAPDLIVFKDNYLSYASFKNKVDAESLAQPGFVEGALSQHTTEETIMEVTNNPNIVNPNPGDYDEPMLNK